MDTYISNKIRNISFILTLLVVLLYSYNLPENMGMNLVSFIEKFISYGISTIAVPIFFMISGYLFFYNFKSQILTWIKKYKSRFKSLFIPYIIWCTFWMGVLYLIQLIPQFSSLFPNMVLSEFSIRKIFKYTYIYPIPFQLWYIKSLLECVVISPLIYYAIKIVGKISGPILMILWFFNILDYPIALFCIGYFLAIHNITIEIKIKKYQWFIISLFFIVVTLINTYLSYNQINYMVILKNSVILWGGFSIWIGYDQYGERFNKMYKITRYSFFIYLFHEPLQSVIIRVLFKILKTSQISYIVVYLIAPITTIIICILVSIVLNKYFRRLYNILTGGR